MRMPKKLKFKDEVKISKPKPVLKATDDFATELTYIDNRRIFRSWDIIIKELGNKGTVLDISVDGYKQTPVLTAHGIRVCTRCGMLQPQETLHCKGCGEL